MSNANANAQQFEEQTFIKTNALVMPSADMLNSLNDADVGMAMRAKYWTPQTPGEKIRAYFTGMGVMVSTDQTGKQREVPAANFVGPNGAFITRAPRSWIRCRICPPARRWKSSMKACRRTRLTPARRRSTSFVF